MSEKMAMFQKLCNLFEMAVFAGVGMLLLRAGQKEAGMLGFGAAIALAGVPVRTPNSVIGAAAEEAKRVATAVGISFMIGIVALGVAGCGANDYRVGLGGNASLNDAGALSGVSGNIMFEVSCRESNPMVNFNRNLTLNPFVDGGVK